MSPRADAVATVLETCIQANKKQRSYDAGAPYSRSQSEIPDSFHMCMSESFFGFPLPRRET